MCYKLHVIENDRYTMKGDKLCIKGLVMGGGGVIEGDQVDHTV